ncbi:FAD-dependent oxidoreductase [Paraburkholderia sp. BL25I1N1]|uniref:FAD-dependent oxidoreductase n=1 Tax=Paraburkholderia sp. BL25I1N1 TaxID=1938804 RepID=UPI000D059C46|nr:FAD-dependent oxidoreductase [Paraburkholderia sp. BL25I1N1]
MASAVKADAPFSSLDDRHLQAHPLLSDSEIERMRAFGIEQHFQAGERLLESGMPVPGMFVLLSGRISITRRDGLGRVNEVMEQQPGRFVAEIGQLSGRPSLVDGHAVGDVTVILIPPERLRALLVAEAELGERIMRSLILRRVRLIERGTGPILLGKSDDARLILLQGFLSRNGHPHTVIDADTDPDAILLLERMARSDADLPLVICPDGTVLRAPDENQLASQLGWLPEFDPAHTYDVAIVGAGPAGLATAVYAASEGLSVAVFDSRAPGGQAGASSRIENYLGFPTGISGQALAGRAFVQAQKFGAHIAIPTQIKALHCDRVPIEIELMNGQHVASHTVVIATGAAYRKPAIAGLERFEGHGTYYWASPVEAKLCKGCEVALVGGGNSAGQAVVYLASHASHVHLLIRSEGLETSMSRYLIDRIAALPNVTLHRRTSIESMAGDGDALSALNCTTPNGPLTLEVRHLFLFTGANPNTSWLDGCSVNTDQGGFVLTGSAVAGSVAYGTKSLETSVPGVFAIGDVRSESTKRVAAAVGEGAAVVSQIHGVLGARQALAQRANATPA